MRNILQALNERPIAYYPIYRKITGSTTAGIYLSQLMYWFSKKDKIFKTDAEIMEETLLTKKEVENAKKLIKKLDFITVSREGIPAKTYYEIDWNLFQIHLNTATQNEETSIHETEEQVYPKGGNCNTQKVETNIVKSLTTETTTETTTEIKKIYNKKNEEIISHLNSLLNTSYKSTTAKTQALIQARLNEGFDVEDFKRVHINKAAEWIGTDYEKYLRPETLYSNKFEGYLNQKVTDYEKLSVISSQTGMSALEILQQQGVA